MSLPVSITPRTVNLKAQEYDANSFAYYTTDGILRVIRKRNRKHVPRDLGKVIGYVNWLPSPEHIVLNKIEL